MPSRKDKTEVNFDFSEYATVTGEMEDESKKKAEHQKPASVNHKAKVAKKTTEAQSQHKKKAESRSQRKQILITPDTNNLINLIARYDGVSQNEIINEAIKKFLKSKMRDSDLKEFINKRS